MLALFALALPVDAFAAAHAGLLWEEREPARFVYASDLKARPYSSAISFSAYAGISDREIPI